MGKHPVHESTRATLAPFCRSGHRWVPKKGPHLISLDPRALLEKIGDVANADTAGAAGKDNAPPQCITGHGAHEMRHCR